MAKGERAAWLANRGREFWSARGAPQGEPRGKWSKQFAHRKERRESRELERQALIQKEADRA